MSVNNTIGGVSPLKAKYTTQTSFRVPEKWVKPTSGGTSYYGTKGGVSGDKGSTTEDSTTEETIYGNLEPYRKVWDRNDNDLQTKYEDDPDPNAKDYMSAFDKFEAAAEDWWKKESKKAGISVEEFKKTYKKKKK